MGNTRFLESGLLSKIDISQIEIFSRPCRPRLLIVTDGSLNFTPDSGFGLWRFIHGITFATGVTRKPVITLGFRGVHPTPTVTVETDVYTVQSNFNFATANPAVNLTNYDQIWMFGFNTTVLTNAEIGVISDFMNSGGGVFATGDHATIGQGMCGSLPRIRHMRDWSSVPMGLEFPTTAVNRIDTVVNPGSNNLFEFDDQSDNIPQRIYPNYKVTSTGVGNNWEARVHPVLMLPGAVGVRTNTDPNVITQFSQDVDVLPDHPHESVCFEVTDAVILGGKFTLGGQNFEEFRPSVAAAVKFGSEIVAFAVAGGRAIVRGGGVKPPVRPRMFGVISAYDGRLAQSYPTKTQRPGRIVCDSTWHHYVNINLDGVGASPRNGLGTWSGGSPLNGTFTPSADLDKIYVYYRNMISWLQPANRIWCPIWWDLVAVRYHPLIIEELLEVPKIKTWNDFVGLGKEAAGLITTDQGFVAIREMLTSALIGQNFTEGFGDILANDDFKDTNFSSDEIVLGMLGALVAKVTTLLPDDDSKTISKVLKTGIEGYFKELVSEQMRVVKLGFDEAQKRADRTTDVLKEKTSVLRKIKPN